MTGEAVHRRRVRMSAGMTRHAIVIEVVAGKAGLVRACHSGRFVDETLVAAAFDVALAVAMALFADGIGNHTIDSFAVTVGIGDEGLGLFVVTIAAGGNRCRLLGKQRNTQNDQEEQCVRQAPPPATGGLDRRGRLSYTGSPRALEPADPSKFDSHRRLPYWACTLSTAQSLPAPWHVAHASAGVVGWPGNVAVLRNACAAASRLSWQPRHAAVAGPCGE